MNRVMLEDGRTVSQADYKVAHAAGWDAGNRSCKAAGRSEWSMEDRDAAAETMDRVMRALAS
jgi:hypothetical protein